MMHGIQAQWFTPVIPALGRWKKGNPEFKVILGFLETSRPAWAKWEPPLWSVCVWGWGVMHGPIIWSALAVLSMCPKELKTQSWREICISRLTEALFTVAKKQKQHRSNDEEKCKNAVYSYREIRTLYKFENRRACYTTGKPERIPDKVGLNKHEATRPLKQCILKK